VKTRIVVADQSEARFFDVVAGRQLKPVGVLTNPGARFHDRDLKSDRPGRVVNGTVPGRRRGAALHHAVGGENTPRRHILTSFAHRIVRELEHARNAGKIDRLVIVAAPLMLGQLRKSLTSGLRARLCAAVAKDVAHDSHADLLRHFTTETLRGPLGFVPAPRMALRAAARSTDNTARI
jgi:protein required for attachment to host cells